MTAFTMPTTQQWSHNNLPSGGGMIIVFDDHVIINMMISTPDGTCTTFSKLGLRIHPGMENDFRQVGYNDQIIEGLKLFVRDVCASPLEKLSDMVEELP